jgi:hypothetical protein
MTASVVLNLGGYFLILWRGRHLVSVGLGEVYRKRVQKPPKGNRQDAKCSSTVSERKRDGREKWRRGVRRRRKERKRKRPLHLDPCLSPLPMPVTFDPCGTIPEQPTVPTADAALLGRGVAGPWGGLLAQMS